MGNVTSGLKICQFIGKIWIESRHTKKRAHTHIHARTQYQNPVCPCDVKGKIKVVPVPFLTEHQAMKVYWGSGGIVPRI
jgi:hypothetical protein